MIDFNVIRYDAYRGIPDLMLPIAHNLGVHPSDEALERQRLASGCIALIDDTWDKDTAARATLLDYWVGLAQQEAVQAPAELLPQLTNDMEALHAQVTPAQAGHFFGLGQRAINLSVQYSSCANLSDYLKMRMEEGRVAGEMTVAVMPDSEAAHPNYQTYTEFSSRLMGVGNVIDSMADLRVDFTAGETAVKPTMLNVARLGFGILPEISRCFVALGPTAAVSFWARSIAEGRRLIALKKAEAA
jgi:hypothetical protein